MVETTIILQGKEAQKWTMMNMLDSIGFFDIAYGRVTIDFDGQKKISNIKVERNYRVAPTGA